MASGELKNLGDIGAERIRTVSQIEDIMHTFEGIALAFEEAVIGFQRNARTSEEAPTDPGLLTILNGAKGGAEEIRTSVVRFLSAFFEYYRQDIQEAQRGERMENDALTN